MDPRVAIVTGGSGGVGRAVGVALTRRGVGTVVFAQRGDASAACEEVRISGGRALSLYLDVATRSSVVDFFAAFEATTGGRLDYLVNCAGACPRTTVDEMREDEMRSVLAVNVEGPFWMCQLARPLLWRSGGGSIVNVGSLAGEDGAAFASPAYTIAKAGLRGMTMQLAKNGFPPATVARGTQAAAAAGVPYIRANCVAPGPIPTAMLDGVEPEALEKLAAATLTGRLTSTAEVAAAVVFLLLDATNVTGQVLQLSGGVIRR
jgi:3-oxoacyl-[acyl-carrier protein] reductase